MSFMETYKAAEALRKKYDLLRKEIEEIIEKHSNSTAGLGEDLIITILIETLQKDNDIK